MLRRIVVIAAAIIAVCADRPQAQPPAQPASTVAIRAGRLIDPDTGIAAANQVILVQGERITAIGADVAIPAGAQVIDLSKLTVLPGLVDAHTHQALTYKEVPENNIYYSTFANDSTALRAIQAASNALQLLGSGFTVIRDVGNMVSRYTTRDSRGLLPPVPKVLLFAINRARRLPVCRLPLP